MVLYNQAEWLAELARLRHARNFTCLLEARHLPGLLVHEHHNCFFSSENDLRSTDGPGLAKVRHHLASEAFKRGMHALSLECSKVYQDHEVIHARGFKLPDSATHLLSITKQDESCCLQLVIAAPLRIESATHVAVECFQPLPGQRPGFLTRKCEELRLYQAFPH